MFEPIIIETGHVPPVGRERRPALPLMDLPAGQSFWVGCPPQARWPHMQVARHVITTGDNMIVRREKRDGHDGVRVFHLVD